MRSAGSGHGYVWNGILVTNFKIYYSLSNNLLLPLDVYFTPVVCFLLMSVGDYVGRTSAGIIPMVNC